MMVNFRDMTRNIMAREKALYEGHAVAAVAATNEAVAAQALKLIDVEYEVLPHVIDVEEAMGPDAPLLHDNMYTIGVEPKPAKPSNIAKRVEFALGDIAAGFAKRDIVVEREFTTAPVHQGYIEPHACSRACPRTVRRSCGAPRRDTSSCAASARSCSAWISKLRVTASEIGGGFGGKTVVYLEPARARALAQGQPRSRWSCRAPTCSRRPARPPARKCGSRSAPRGRHDHRRLRRLKYQAGAFQGSPVQPGGMCAFAPYDIDNVRVIGFDVVSNRPKVAAYRAPGGPIAEFAVESVIDELAKKLELDPIEFRLKNAAKEGTKAAYGPEVRSDRPGGDARSGRGQRALPRRSKHQGRGVASGFWFNIGGETCAALNGHEDGSVRWLRARRTSAARARRSP